MSQNPSTGLPVEDIDMIATWLVADRTRWLAGIVAGLFSGVLALGVAGVLSYINELEFLYPLKLMATPILGLEATDYSAGFFTILTGFIFFESMCALWGFVYAHFVKTNSLGSLLAMGAVWGFFSWVFEWNLFLHSVKPILYAGVPASAALLVCMVYGVSMSSVAFFDRSLR